MPIYEYQCVRCGEFEVMQKITESALTRCPTCRGKVSKLISNTSFQLKGAGWYVTDYARKDGAKPEIKAEGKSETEGSKSESKAEKKETSSDNKAKPTPSAAAG